VPLRIKRPAAGTKLSLTPAMVQLNADKLPYDIRKAETIPSQETGSWLVSFAAPEQLGRIRPKRATLDLRVTVPVQSLAIRTNQCAEEKPRANESVEPVAQWDRQIGAKRVTLDLVPGDYDSQGHVWLLITVAQQGGTAANPAPWQIRDLKMAIEAEAME
jgi:hypothetical protein